MNCTQEFMKSMLYINCTHEFMKSMLSCFDNTNYKTIINILLKGSQIAINESWAYEINQNSKLALNRFHIL